MEVALKMAFRKFGADRGLDDAAMAQLQVMTKQGPSRSPKRVENHDTTLQDA